ncbi:MAG: 3-dehydroquinate synthase [Evtepia sp.]
MTTISVDHNYPVWIGADIRELGEKLDKKAKTIVVVTDTQVAPLYLEEAATSLKRAGFAVLSFVFPAGEQSKSGKTYFELLEFLAQNQITRTDGLVALGGGVVGDLTGFAAATYQRGITFVQVPTTLLAAVDSSVGGKTAINLNTGKNLVGAFYKPRFVLCDTRMLKTLPKENWADGWAEVIKYGMIGNASLLEKLESEQEIASIISDCVAMKAAVVAEDEFDQGNRQLLNFGHTVGHALEVCSAYEISHGQAVAIGMEVITRAATRQNLCPAECLTVLRGLLRRYGLPESTEFDTQTIFEHTLSDKKRGGDTITLVVPTAVGQCVLRRVGLDELRYWIDLGVKA